MTINELKCSDTNFIKAFFVYFPMAIYSTEVAYLQPVTNINEIIRTIDESGKKTYPFLIKFFLKKNKNNLEIFINNKDEEYQIYLQNELIMELSTEFPKDILCNIINESSYYGTFTAFYDKNGYLKDQDPDNFRKELRDTLKHYSELGYLRYEKIDSLPTKVLYKYDVLHGLKVDCLSNKIAYSPFTRSVEQLMAKYCRKHKLSRIICVSWLLELPGN